MRRFGKNIFFLLFGLILSGFAFPQKDWTLVNDENWIQIYKSDMANSSYKRVKVECTINGTMDKLVRILNDVNNYKNWIYHTKNAFVLKRINANEYYYYMETTLPWPMQNRDAAVHIKLQKDSNNRSLNIVAFVEPDYMPVVSRKIRVPRATNTWQVTAPAPDKLHIVYIFEADPGGHILPWLVNTFVNKGPYESFKKLAQTLKD